MSLIECPECRRQVSDQAAACVGCGYPLASVAPRQQEGQRSLDAVCANCGLSDLTQRASVIMQQEVIQTQSVGSMTLDGAIRTVDHGRYQQAFGSRWIFTTRAFREGSVSRLSATATTSTSGQQVSLLAANWIEAMPPSDGTQAYFEALDRFASAIFCRRCGGFTVEGSYRPLDHHVVEAFGIQRVLPSALESWGQIPPSWLGKTIVSGPFHKFSQRERIERPGAALAEVTHRLAPIEPREVARSETAIGDYRVTFLELDAGSEAKARMLGALGGWKHQPPVAGTFE